MGNEKHKRSKIITRILILRKILLLNDGRDKVLKVLQYTAKVLLWGVLKDPKDVLYDKSKKLSTHFSIARKIVRLGHWLEPFNDTLDLYQQGLGIKSNMPASEQTARLLAPLNAVNSIVNDLLDDIICLGKLGLLDKKWVEWASPLSDRCWFASLFIDIHENVLNTTKIVQKLEIAPNEMRGELVQKLFLQRVSLAKLGCDFVFCTIDVFELNERVGDGVQAVAGLTAAILGTLKLVIKNQ